VSTGIGTRVESSSVTRKKTNDRVRRLALLRELLTPLETKCIPTGMELFPATSTAQWNLIRQVIDECDYYVVIVAGRYGSTDSSGLGYTEREFDYARQIGKPIIGFYHSDLERLTGSKLERTDLGKKRLMAFTEKVKGALLCRSWTTAADLGSAVKSAIIHALEHDPQPGWMRADVVSTADDHCSQYARGSAPLVRRSGRSVSSVRVRSKPRPGSQADARSGFA
jgi:hypothetical protein